MKVLIDIPKEVLDEIYAAEPGNFSIDMTLEFSHNHKSVAANRKYRVESIWTNDSKCREFRYVTMDD